MNHTFTTSLTPTLPASPCSSSPRLRGSEFKNALDALPLGTQVELEGPYGSFTLPEDVERVAFITGGIGITCVRSILRRLADRPPAIPIPQEIVLLFANPSENAIPFRDEWQRLEAALSRLRVVHVLSRAGQGWRGYRGHIDERILAAELSEPGNRAYYLCGAPSMVRAMEELLLAWGVETESMKVEQFEGYE